MPLRLLALVAALSLLAGCDQLGLESASVTAARVEADGKAVGAACRHGGRAIEDCFTLNRKTDKAAIYAGWREMDDYMRENKIEPVAPSLPAVPDTRPKVASAGDDAADPASAAAGGGKDDAADRSTAAKPAAKPPAKADKTAATDTDKAAAPH